MTELRQERDFFQGQAEGKTVTVSPASTPEKHHMVVELTECKARIRKLKQELWVVRSCVDESRAHLCCSVSF